MKSFINRMPTISTTRLRTQLLSYFIIITAIPLLIIGSLSLYQMNQTQQFVIEQELAELNEIGEYNAEFITEWINVRMDEMRYLASLDAAGQMNVGELDHLLDRLAESNGFYDTIYAVSPEGIGLSGITFENESSSILSQADVNDFDVADRDWFQSAISGEDTISQPLLSRSTGNHVITLATPIYDETNGIIGVMRGAVLLDTIFERIQSLDIGEYADAYLIDSEQMLVTPARSVEDSEASVNTVAAQAIANNESGSSSYDDPAGNAVLGSYQYIPLLDWGLVLEVEEQSALQAENQLQTQMITLFSIVIVVSILLIAFIAFAIARSLSKPIIQMVNGVQRVANGDLRETIDIQAHQLKSKNEIHQLAQFFNKMTESLQQLVSQVVDKSQNVASTSEELTASTEQISKATEEITESIQNVATGAEQQMKTSEQTTALSNNTAKEAQQVATHMEKIDQSTSRTASLSADGDKLVQKAVQQIEIINERTISSEKVVKMLDDKTKEIGQIVTVITEIAEQTNLLSLNASIEAARAGEHGKGFAVVASEVRKLAENTATSSQQIATLINETQLETVAAVEAMIETRKMVHEGTEYVSSAGHAFKDITEAVTGVSKQVKDIMSSVQSMNETIQKVVEANEAVTELSRESASYSENVASASEEQNATMEEIASAANELAYMAEELNKTVEHFKY
ncbi:methyl-accepting chemotaxis protein [Halalkalibacter hemicellulosilyticus]|uniref:Methyl-accepting chemotaxis sensory transducer n=1 Tax=Halalkalibacter hemicellulosilyticusJCM 9152 TaxID=1236971 RepID=W4QEA2_9BACI|nr:methyl-accepting chemotaxis protein [Halalkalibacter hemicellulosilyticus]GAE29689.1 methyl-accepting chemotaxis sensory transducer [Halalkalibacter hemicellulosilyticusJCM 9152]